jgi:hypothetical protein
MAGESVDAEQAVPQEMVDDYDFLNPTLSRLKVASACQKVTAE